jgi:hypothetical protein
VDTQGGQCVLRCHYPFEVESPNGGPADRLEDAEDRQTDADLQLGVETVRADIAANCRKIETSATHQHPGGAFAKHWQLELELCWGAPYCV